MLDNPFKRAATDRPINELLAARWSPYTFDPRPVETDKLWACLEAARWAASSFNEQPWTFLIAQRNDQAEFEKMVDCLAEANQPWATQAGVLMLTAICRTFTRNGKPNRVAEHDLGLAVANLTVQATELGLAVHQMAGVNLSKIRQVYSIPETHDPFTGVAIGYPLPPDQASDPQLAEREQKPRSRKPLSEFVFTSSWSQPFAP